MKNKYGPWALVTGAAMGLGAEFALQIAQKGIHIIGADIHKKELDSTLRNIEEQTGVKTLSVALDLSQTNFMDSLLPAIQGLEVGFLVNNAGISNIGYFAKQETDFLLRQLHINTTAVLMLSHYFARQMMAKKRGGIIILSSGAGQLSSAYNASYSATKAYDLMLAESLWAELKPFNIDVLGFMPGPTKTPGYAGQGGDVNGSLVMSASETVRQALAQLGKQPSYYAGSFIMRQVHQLITRFFRTKWRINLVSKEIKKMFAVKAYEE